MFSSQIYESWRSAQNEKFAFLLEHIPNLFTDTVLDLACGQNFLKQFLESKNIGCKVIGADIEGGDVVADANNLPFVDGSFEKIICIDALHLFGNDFQRILKRNGTILAGIFFNNESFEEKRRLLLKKLDGLKIIDELIFIGKENELFIVARRL